ncbi:MAG: PDZ domain-containing protein [Gemmatimonadales bacterium]|jgi:membrane-associated protease RseP (regulator of RpoE activity)
MLSSRFRSAGRWLFLLPVLVLGQGTGLEAQEQHGWIGINFDDSVCRAEKRDDGLTEVWVCSIPPMIDTVYQGGPAYVAGIQAGDVIVGVDGFDITTDEGGRRFANMRLGVPVTFWLRRDGEELALTVTPGTREESFPEEVLQWVSVGPETYDSLAVQIRLLFQGQLKLQHALKDAEMTLRRTEAQMREDPSESRRLEVRQLRQQIDSINTRLLESQRQIRLQVDSLASRAWTVVPEPSVARPEVRRVEPDESGVVTIYSDAVAGARFQKLDEGSPLIDYFPGVDAGLLVIEVVAETPAALCGLRAGDVVLEVNEEPVTTVSELRRRLRGEVDITFVRLGRKHFCTITSR